MPEILYFAPPASLVERPEVPVLAEGNSERDKLGVDDDEEQKVRGPQRDELWVTPDTREALVAPYLVSWRNKIERLGTMNFPQAAWRAPGTRNPDVEVIILADGTLESATIDSFERLGQARPGRRGHLETRQSLRSVSQGTRGPLPPVAFHLRLGICGGRRVRRGTVTAPADSQ